MSSPLDVVVRFSSGSPDVILHITSPSATTALSLKQLIRTNTTPPTSTSRLRLIHAGRVLQDTAALSTSLNTLPPPLPSTSDPKTSKAKGKLPIRDPPARVYVHCSVSDPLTPSELTDEARQAQDADDALLKSTTTLSQPIPLDPSTDATDPSTSSTAPRGFDRLLSAGFTPSEVATLRSQFLAIQAQTHTPDTMPSGAALLALEERWLDNGSDAANAGGGGNEDVGGFGFEAAGGLEDLLWGNLMGFFWPLGAMVWLMREEGVWSPRRQIAVLSGFLANLAFGLLRVMV